MPIEFDDDEWEAESDVRTLADADKIKNDPQRLSRAQTKAKQQMEAAAKVADAGAESDSDMLEKGFRKL